MRSWGKTPCDKNLAVKLPPRLTAGNLFIVTVNAVAYTFYLTVALHLCQEGTDSRGAYHSLIRDFRSCRDSDAFKGITDER